MINKYFCMGNLTRDPEYITTPNGNRLAKFGLAINDKKDGDAVFVDVTAWNKTAEIVESNGLKKGTAIHLEGSLCYDSWEIRRQEPGEASFILMPSRS